MSDSAAAAARTGILVVGMHRTGTSALARILGLHGADLGSDVTPPDEHHPRGYWVEAHLRRASLGFGVDEPREGAKVGGPAHLDLPSGRRDLTVEAGLGSGLWAAPATPHVDVSPGGGGR